MYFFSTPDFPARLFHLAAIRSETYSRRSENLIIKTFSSFTRTVRVQHLPNQRRNAWTFTYNPTDFKQPEKDWRRQEFHLNHKAPGACNYLRQISFWQAIQVRCKGTRTRFIFRACCWPGNIVSPGAPFRDVNRCNVALRHHFFFEPAGLINSNYAFSDFTFFWISPTNIFIDETPF